MNNGSSIHEDPVCKMPVDASRAYYISYHEGQVYYFCCSWCRTRFERHPEHFIEKIENQHEENSGH